VTVYLVIVPVTIIVTSLVWLGVMYARFRAFKVDQQVDSWPEHYSDGDRGPYGKRCIFHAKTGTWCCVSECRRNTFRQQQAQHLLQTASWYTVDNGKFTDVRIRDGIRDGKNGWIVLTVTDDEELDAVIAALEAGESDCAVRIHNEWKQLKRINN
jgi:hypothetical protein